MTVTVSTAPWITWRHRSDAVLLDLATAALVLVGVVAIAEVGTCWWLETVWLPRMAGED